MRLAIFSYARLVQGGGFEKYAIDLATAMARRGHAVDIVTTNRSEYRALQMVMNLTYGNSLLFDHSQTSSDELRDRIAPAILHEASPAEQRRLLSRADVIYTKNELVDLSSLWPHRRTNPPVVCGIHTSLLYPNAKSTYARAHNALYLGAVYRRLLSQVRAIHCLSPEYRTLLDCFQLAIDKPSHTIALPVLAEGGSAEVAKTDTVTVLFAGRLTEQKGVDILLDAIRLLPNDEACRIRVRIAGSGNEMLVRQVQQEATRNAFISYLGHLDSAGLAACYREATVAVVPSRWETFPYACIEALAFGVPVICSDVPGCRDIVRPEETGIVVRANSAHALADGIVRMAGIALRSPDRYRAMRRDAAAEAWAHYRPELIFGRMERMFREVVRNEACQDGPDHPRLC